MKEALGSEAKLVSGARGAFEIFADEELVFSKLREGRYPSASEIVAALRNST